MHPKHLRGVDLNLLVLLDALLTHRAVGHAAAAVNLSQPAMSRALGRLRALLDDPLVLRVGNASRLTPRGEALAAPVRRLLAQASDVIFPVRFDPAGWKGRVLLGATDHQAILLLPPLMARLARDAPRLDVELRPLLAAALPALRRGDLHLGFGPSDRLPSGFASEPLYGDRFVTLMRRGHPVAAGPLTPERFAALDHVLVTTIGDGPGAVDVALAELGLERRVAVRQPHFYAALAIVARTDLLVTLPGSIADRFAPGLELERRPTPVAGEPFAIAAIWSEALTRDPAQAWFRASVRKAAAEAGLARLAA